MIQELSSKLSNRKSYYKTIEINRSREETRTVHVFDATEDIKKYMWHIKTIVKITRKRKLDGKTSQQIVYYVSDRKLDAKELHKGIRNHWSIENNLHWVKDVILQEDKLVKQKNAAFLNGLLRSFVVTIGNQLTKSTVEFQRLYAHNLELIRYLTE